MENDAMAKGSNKSLCRDVYKINVNFKSFLTFVAWGLNTFPRHVFHATCTVFLQYSVARYVPFSTN
jgi:hypothetical protein